MEPGLSPLHSMRVFRDQGSEPHVSCVGRQFILDVKSPYGLGGLSEVGEGEEKGTHF